MAKNTNTKASKPVIKTTAPAPAPKATRHRDAVLVVKTVDELVALLPGDAKIGVSRKSLICALTKLKVGDIKAEAGL